MKRITFNSVKEMVNWLIDNEGVVLHDFYGRRWIYDKFSFRYSDIGETMFLEDNLGCMHLYRTGFKYLLK